MLQPNLQHDLTQKADQYFRQLIAEVQQLHTRVSAVETSQPLTQKQALLQFGPATISAALQANGSAPLNITGLAGKTAHPQTPSIPTVSALPNFEDPLSQDGTMVSFNAVIYRYDGTVEPGKWFALGAVAVLLEDSHANRANYPATDYPLNAVYFETDRHVFYHVQLVTAVKTWVYLTATFVSAFANKPLDLGTNDTGFLWKVTDYAHKLQWTGAAWQAAPGEVWDTGKITGFLIDPDPASGWHLCDGTVGVTYLKKDGTLGTVTLPDLVSAANKAAYLKFGSPANAVVNAAIAPALTMNSYTPVGTVSQPALVMNAYTPTGTVSQPTFAGSALATHQHQLPMIYESSTVTHFTGPSFGTGASRGQGARITTVAESGTSAAVLLDQAVSAGTPAGTVSQPTFAGTPATLTGTVAQPIFTGTPATLTGTIAATAEPQNLVLRPWFRQ